jgi:hypothetical protein
MADAVLSGVKVNDKLFVQAARSSRIEPVLRITPTGRVITQSGTFDVHGYLRGQRRPWAVTRARLATEDNIAGVDRVTVVQKLSHFDWGKLNADDLKAIWAIASK